MKNDKETLSHDTLLSQLHYERETGLFTRKIVKGGRLSGTRAGYLIQNGYRYIGMANATLKYKEARDGSED